jgi:uncharacterized protein YbaP (TraB family)
MMRLKTLLSGALVAKPEHRPTNIDPPALPRPPLYANWARPRLLYTHRVATLVLLVLFPFFAPAHADGAHSPVWIAQGKHNTVYLAGSVHYLSPTEKLPAALDTAYARSKKVIMEIDLSTVDAGEVQSTMMELGMLPEGKTLEHELGAQTYHTLTERVEKLGLPIEMMAQFQPWLAALTITQLQLASMGLDPNSGVEQRLLARATADGKPMEGLETLAEQLGVLAQLPAAQQRQFLLYSLQDADDESKELNQLLAAWRSGDAATLAALLQQNFKEFPDLYRPLTVDRNRRWITRLQEVLTESDDVLVLVGALHLVGKDSVVDLLQRAGYQVKQL